MTRSNQSSAAKDKPPGLDGVTPREAQVVLRILQGATYQEIADIMKVGLETVRDAVDRLRDKTGLRRKANLAVWAVRHEVALQRLATTTE